MSNKVSKEFQRIVIGFIGLLAVSACGKTADVNKLLNIQKALARKTYLR